MTNGTGDAGEICAFRLVTTRPGPPYDHRYRGRSGHGSCSTTSRTAWTCWPAGQALIPASGRGPDRVDRIAGGGFRVIAWGGTFGSRHRQDGLTRLCERWQCASRWLR
jgi:hypothetical protein